MFILSEDGTEAVNTKYIIDLEIIENADTREHTWRVSANLHYPDRSRRVVLFEDNRRQVAEEMLKTYIHLMKGTTRT